MNAEQQAKQWGQIVAKAGQDEMFRKRLLADPSTVVKEFGVEVPAGVQLRVVENTDQVLHLALLPLAGQQDKELSDEELEGVAGGLVVIAIIGIIIGQLLPSVQKLTKEETAALASAKGSAK